MTASRCDGNGDDETSSPMCNNNPIRLVSSSGVNSTPPQQRIRRNTAESDVQRHPSDAVPIATSPSSSSSSSLSSSSLIVNGNVTDVDANVATTIVATASRTTNNVCSIWKLVCLNMMVCGIEICASAGFTYLPPMMLKSGFAQTSMTFAMGIGPFLALLVVPFLGRWSDRCRSRLGRRKPFLIGISLIMMVSLSLIAYGHRIGSFFAPKDHHHLRTILLTLGVVLLDFGCHAGFNPCEALVADFMKSSDEADDIGFVVYSTMISFGGCIGYIITAVDWSSINLFASSVANYDDDDDAFASGEDFDQDQIAFTVIMVMFVITSLTTIIAAKVERTDNLNDVWPDNAKDPLCIAYRTNRVGHDATSTVDMTNYGGSTTTTTTTSGSSTTDSSSEDVGYETSHSEFTRSSIVLASKRPLIKGTLSMSSSRFLDLDDHDQGQDHRGHHRHRISYSNCSKIIKMLVVVSYAPFKFRIAAINLRIFVRTLFAYYRDWPFLLVRLPVTLFRRLSTIRNYVRHRLDVPLVLRRLFVADFCSWTALMCHNMFYTDYVGQAVYGGSPNAAENDVIGRRLYDDGVRMGSWGLLLHSITSIVYVNTLQNSLIRAYGLKRTYLVGLAVFAVSMILTLATDNLAFINLLAALSGTGFAAITTIPNMLITAYHSDKTTFFGGNSDRQDMDKADTVDGHKNMDDGGGDCERGIASDFSILDSAYFLSQIALSLSVGTVVDLTQSVTSYIVISAGFAILACFLATRVIFPKDSCPVRTR